MDVLSEEETKQKFLQYFACGKTVVQARKHHQNELKSLENYCVTFLTCRKINPTQKMVREWYSEWRNTQSNSSPELREQTSVEPSSIDSQSILLTLAEIFLRCDSNGGIISRIIGNSGLIRLRRFAVRNLDTKKSISRRHKRIFFIPKYKSIKAVGTK